MKENIILIKNGIMINVDVSVKKKTYMWTRLYLESCCMINI